jgi:pyruvate/2-oxoglutarate dehydrogenase complex dihydrolipoamide dehydrogenase (E3) component
MSMTVLHEEDHIKAQTAIDSVLGAQALLHSSHIYHGAKSDYSNYGVMVDNVQIDIKKMMAQKDKAVTGLTKGVEGLFKKNKVGGGSMQGGSDVAGLR